MARNKGPSNAWIHAKGSDDEQLPDEVRFPSLTFLRSIYRNSKEMPWKRIKAAIAALPFEERRYRPFPEGEVIVEFEYDEDTMKRREKIMTARRERYNRERELKMKQASQEKQE